MPNEFSAASKAQDAQHEGRRRTLGLILLLSLLMLMPLLDLAEINNVGEGREGTVIQEIIDSGNYILPLRNGDIVPSKPMMYHWLALPGAMLLGKVNLFTIRLPSALAGIATLLALASVAFTLFGRRAAISSAIILLTSQGFVSVSMEGRVDSVFSCFVSLAVLMWFGSAGKHRAAGLSAIPERVYLLSAVFMGCAVLTKGPLGFALVGLIIGSISLWEFGWKSLRFLVRPSWLLAPLISVPWYLAAAAHGGEGFVGRQIIYENLRRLTGGAGITHQPFWYYFPQFFSFAAPWSVALVLLLVWAIRNHRTTSIFSSIFSRPHRDSSNEALQSERAPSAFAAEQAAFGIRSGLAWLLVPMVLLSFSSGKHSAYLLPLMPGFSLILGLWLSEFMRFPQQAPRAEFAGRVLTGVVLALGPLVVGLSIAAENFAFHLGRGLKLSSSQLMPALEPRLWLVLAFYLAAALGVFQLYRTRSQRAGLFEAWGPILIGLLLLAFGVYMPIARAVKGLTHGDRAFAEELAAKIPSSEPIRWVMPAGQDERLGVGRDDSFDSLFFYLHRHVLRRDSAKAWDEPGLYVARRSWVEAQTTDWQKRIRLRFEGGKLDDYPGERLMVFDLAPTAPGS